MAGLYIHIPFCKTRCIYCDFYSTASNDKKTRFINALCKEIAMRKDYINNESIDTIYFGGGTPSQLSIDEFKQIFDAIDKTFGEIKAKEITLEANPDDLTEAYTNDLIQKLPFNRISMGVQSFNNNMLKTLNRRHNCEQAVKAVATCRKAGFQNISIDLMYGLPGETIEDWHNDLNQAIELDVEHISAYHLIYEKDTLLYKLRENKQLKEVEEESSLLFFETLIKRLTEKGYEHYEISNFSKPQLYSKHNTSYWQGVHYLGCGPSAHSYNGNEREWNIASLTHYIDGIESGNRDFEKEIIDINTDYNEYIITRLRTKWGISLNRIKSRYGEKYYSYFLKMSLTHLNSGKLERIDDIIKLSKNGIFVSDDIMSDLLYIEE